MKSYKRSRNPQESKNWRQDIKVRKYQMKVIRTSKKKKLKIAT